MANVTMPNGDVVAFPDDMPKAQIRSLIEKKFPTAQREALARTGEKPYQNALEATATAIGNLPASIAESKYGLGQMAAEAVTDIIDPQVSRGTTPPLKVTPGGPIADLVTQPAAPAYRVEGTGWNQLLPDKTLSPLNLLALLPEDVRRGIGESAAYTSLGQQLRRAEAAKGQKAIDVAPGSLEEIVSSAGASTVEMIGPAVVSVMAKNPGPLVAYFTARSAGSGYNTARDAGAGADTSRAAAGLYAAAEAVTEALAGKVFIDGGKTLVGSMLKGLGVEGLTEGATEALQALVDSQVIGKDMTWDEALNRIKVAGAAGAIAGGTVGGVTHGISEAGAKPTQGIEVVEPAAAEVEETPIEDNLALPAPATLLALPSPESFKTPDLPRRQGPAPAAKAEPVAPTPTPTPTEDERDYQARVALQKTRQAETAELLQTARETITPLGTFDVDEIGEAAAGKVRQHRIQMGRPVEAPVTIEDMARAKVPQRQIDAVIAQRRPVTSETALTALDIMRAADAKNIIPTDGNFAELALRVTGQRNPARMTQAQLNALKTTLDSMPAHDKPVTVPLAEQSPFTDDQYGKALDAVRKQGRYTATAIKEATGLKGTKDVDAIRDAMVRRGQLVQRGKSDYRLYDTLGEERQTVPDDLPAGAFKEYTTKRVPVARVRVVKDGKSVGTFGSAAEARGKVSSLRSADGGAKAAISIEPAEEVAWGVMENRYDEQGNLLGSVVVDSHRDETAAAEATAKLNTPADTGARYTQTDVSQPANIDDEIDRRLPYLKQDDLLAKDAAYQNDMREWQRLTDEINAGTGLGDKTKQMLSPDEARARMAQREPIADRLRKKQESAKTAAATRRIERAELREKLEVRGTANPRSTPHTRQQRPPMPAAFTGRLPEITKRLNDQARERKLPLLGVKVKIEPSIVTPEGEAIEGFYFRKLISLTAQNLTPQMSTDEIVERLGQVMDHETIHALRAADVLGPETDGWKTIVRYAKKAQRPGSTETYMEWARRNYADVPGYGTNDAIEEEAIAEAFRHWAANRRDVAGKPATVFRQIVDWFKRLVSSLPEDAFKAIESGQMVADALKPPGGEMPRATATRKMEAAAAEISVAQKAMDENLVRVKSREFLRARAQARDDRYGKSGPKTVLGTTPSKAYAVGDVGNTEFVREVADRYRSQNGVQQGRLMTLLPEDIGYLSRIADAQQRLPHAPGDAAVAKSYRALIDETKAMWRALGDIEVTAWTDSGAPYASPAEMLADIEAGRLRMRLSDDMFGPGADNPGHPLNTASGVKTVDGKALTNNDLFRVVHDIYGHGQSGFRDDPRGSYNAYHEHARLLSPEARRALATETLAQRAWQDYGPHLRRRDGTAPRETDVDYLAPRFKEFAEQKAFVLDDEVLGADPGWALADAAASVEETPRFMVGWHGTPHKVDKFSSSKIGTGEGNQSFGHGLYFASSADVAENYRQVLARPAIALDGETVFGDVPKEALTALNFVDSARSVKKGLANLRKAADDTSGDRMKAVYESAHAWLKENESRVSLKGGSLYKVDIPEENEMLDWNASFSAQPEIMRKLGKKYDLAQIADDMFDGKPGDLNGEIFYGWLSGTLGSDRAASKALRKLGIPGHRYIGHESQTPNYVIYDDSRVQILEENPKFSKFDDNLPGGRLYGNPNRSPGGALSAPGTPSPAFTTDRPGNAFFGGELAEHQLQMARTGERGATMIYLAPADYLALTDGSANPEQEVYDAAVGDGFKFSGLPSLVLDGYAGNVRATASDGAFAAVALDGNAPEGGIPVILYPKKGDSLGLVTALEAPDGRRVPWPHDGRAENFPEVRGPRYSVGSEEFRRWFGDSKVVGPDGAPLVVFHGTLNPNFTVFRTGREGGAHFGSAEQANTRIDNLAPLLSPIEKPSSIMPVFLSIQNPLRMKDEGYWSESSIATRALELGVLTYEEAADVQDGKVPSQAALQAKGYDGLVYANFAEGEGDSWVAFEPTQIKSAIANRGTYDAANPDIRYSLNAPFGTRVPSTPPGPMHNIVQQRVDGWVGRAINSIGRSKRSLPVVGSIFDARVKLQDKMLSIKEMIEQIKEAGGDITDLNDTYMLEQLYHGKVFDQIQQREQDLQIPLLEALRAAHDGPAKVQPKDFEDYLYARHAPERNAYLRARGAKDPNPSGMSDAEASTILDRFAIDGKLPELETLAGMADAIVANTTQTRVEAGLISPEAAASSPYQYYVPLRGFAEEELDPGNPSENQSRARSGKGFSVGGREDRTVTGRGRKAGDLLGHLFLQNTESVIRAEKNEVALSFMRLLQENSTLGFGEVLKTAPTRRVVGANGMIQEAGDPSYRQAPDIVTAKWKGQEIIARVADPRLARAIKSDYVSTSNDLVNALVAIGGKLNRYLATVNTSLNPEFLISNLARDMQTAGILSQQYDIKDFGRKIIGNAPKAMAGVREVLRDGTTDSDWAKTFIEMQKAGGTTEFLGIHDLETQRDRILRSITQNGLSTTPRKAMEYIGKVFKFVDDYNKVAENAFRLSAYKAAREAGVSVPQAAFLAKNLTVNFNKGGELKAFMNAMYLFYNASTQGTAVLMNGLKNKRVQKIVAGVVAAGFLQDILNRALSGDEDDNGVTDYDDIPDYVLETNFVMMDPLGLLKSIGIKQGYFSIPMPYGFNAFYNTGRNLSAGFSGSPVRNPGKSAVDSLLGFLDAFNPLGGVQSIWNFVAPTFADPFVDLITNKDYAGNDIVPERPSFGLPVPDSQKYWANTGEVPKWVSEHLNRLTGGNEVRKGVVDISPETLQYGFDFVTGATGKFAQRLGKLGGETIPNAMQGDFEDIAIGDIPFARRVVGSVTSRGNTERYYQVAEEVQTVAEEIKMFQEAGDVEALRRKVAEQPVEVRLIGMFEDAEKALSALRKQLREVRENEAIPDARKRDIVKQIKEQQDLLMARVNSVYFEQKKAGR